MKKTKFEILIFICMILLGLGCFLIATKNNQYNFFEDILSCYPEENIAGTLMVDLTHDGNDELLVISQDALEITLEIYAIIDGNPIVIYKDHASDNHAGWRWYYLTVVDHKNYILQPYSARAKGFPSNPSIGQTCVIDVTIHVDDAATAAGIASEIMAASPYVTLAAALYAANILLTAGSMIYGYTVVLHISYTYGYTNDGVLGWTPGYVSYEIY